MIKRGGILKSNERTVRMVLSCNSLNDKMTPEERDKYFLETEGMTYAEFQEKYKDDTPELLDKEFSEFVKKHSI